MKNRRDSRCQKSAPWQSIVVLVGLGLVFTTTAGCTVSDSTAKTTSTVTTTLVTPREAFDTAKRAWVAGSFASSFEQSTYLRRAATRLSRGVTSRNSEVVLYKSSVKELRQLASLPETSDTSQQKSEARADLHALNVFFDTKGLYE
jgi:uncharacterized NAD(P)/FAD-binding protein YdhS